jgi:hypothetical protein
MDPIKRRAAPLMDTLDVRGRSAAAPFCRIELKAQDFASSMRRSQHVSITANSVAFLPAVSGLTNRLKTV